MERMAVNIRGSPGEGPATKRKPQQMLITQSAQAFRRKDVSLSVLALTLDSDSTAFMDPGLESRVHRRPKAGYRERCQWEKGAPCRGHRLAVCTAPARASWKAGSTEASGNFFLPQAVARSGTKRLA